MVENEGEGLDTIELARSFVLREYFLADHVENLIVRRDLFMILNGNSLNNYIAVTATNTENRLEGLEGDDTLDGGYDVNGLGSIVDVINGGDGYDYADYSKHPSSGVFGGGVFVDLAEGKQYAINTGVALGGLSDQLISIEGVIGTAFDDRFVSGFTGVDRIVGNTFKGGAGMDIVDYRRAGAGVNVVLGDGVESSTRDTFESIEGLTGSEFDDTLDRRTEERLPGWGTSATTFSMVAPDTISSTTFWPPFSDLRSIFETSCRMPASRVDSARTSSLRSRAFGAPSGRTPSGATMPATPSSA